jgi:uncharacterized protein YifN (PemK superfamily)
VVLPFHPIPGEVLWCDFEAEYSTPYHPPEMTKTRRVVVLSPRSRAHRARTVVVVPLSITVPRYIEPFHYKLSVRYRFLHKTEEVWVKGDMVRHVSVERLRPILGRNVAVKQSLTAFDLHATRKAVAAGIGFRLCATPDIAVHRP